MKTKLLTLIVALFMVSLSSFAQKDPVDRLFDKYSGQDGYTTIYISSKMFSLFSQVDPEDEDLQNLMSGLKSIRILAGDDESNVKTKVNFYDEVMKELPVDKYEELMVIKESGQDLKFLIREENNKIVELLLVGGGNSSDDNVLISIRGIIDMKNISKIGKAFDLEGLDNLEKIDEH
ncbi:MAG: DUF4252 domain-containing protein [Bacteroidales bacterium]|nr:DUF4252 domain-containing protein [Bacteroidales bacterium]